MKRSALLAVVIAGLAAGCSNHDGSSEAGDLAAPLVQLAFPPPVSSTDAVAVTVTGTASDPSGVAEVRVNGVLAATSDGFATWQARVPLAPGENTLTVAATDRLRNTDDGAAEARIESQALLDWPSGIVVDPARQLAFVLDGQLAGVKAVDLTSGARTTLSDASHGVGPEFAAASGIALDVERVLVVDRGPPAAVLAVDLANGERRIVSDVSRGAGPAFFNLGGIAVAGGRAIVVDNDDSHATILAVDLASGNRSIVADEQTGTGPILRDVTDLVLDGGRALLLRSPAASIHALDLATGNRSILADETTGTGPLVDPWRIAKNGELVCVTDSYLEAVVAVDLRFGQRAIIAR